jgi:hypothetical protein
MQTTSIVQLLPSAAKQDTTTDDAARTALDQTVKLLKSAVPFQLPVRIVTGHLPPTEIIHHDSDERYVGVFLRWHADFISKPTWDIDDVTEFVSTVRNVVVVDQIADLFESKPKLIPNSLRKRVQDIRGRQLLVAGKAAPRPAGGPVVDDQGAEAGVGDVDHRPVKAQVAHPGARWQDVVVEPQHFENPSV